MTPTPPIAAVPAQPDALRCAEFMEHIANGGDVPDIGHLAQTTAAELRRLHAQVAALTAQGAAERAVPHDKLTMEIDNVLSDPDTTLSPGAERALRWCRTWVSVPLCLAAHVQPPAKTEHVAADVSQNGLESNMTGGDYAELPEPHYEHGDNPSMGEVNCDCYTAYQMRAFADATHALRASHAQAPAGAAEPVVCSECKGVGTVGDHNGERSVEVECDECGGTGIDALRIRFEAMARDSYNFSRSRRGTYNNPATARDWKWFRLGAATAEEMPKPAPTAQAAPAAGAVDGPVLFVSHEQLEGLLSKPDPEEGHGRYLPIRRGPAGKFTHPLYAAPTPAAQGDA